MHTFETIFGKFSFFLKQRPKFVLFICIFFLFHRPIHKKVKAQRKHATTGNPLKTRANRIEIKNEYREVKTNVAEREIKRINVEKCK